MENAEPSEPFEFYGVGKEVELSPCSVCTLDGLKVYEEVVSIVYYMFTRCETPRSIAAETQELPAETLSCGRTDLEPHAAHRLPQAPVAGGSP